MFVLFCTFPIPQLTEIYDCVQSTVLSVGWTSTSVRHQCAVFGSYWVRYSLLGLRMHPQIATALHQCSVSAPDPLFLSISASHSLPVLDPAPPSHPAPWHPPTSRGAPAVVVVAHPLLLPFSTKLAPSGGAAEEQRTRDYISGRAARAGQQWWSSARGGPSPQRRQSSRNSIAVPAASPSSLSLVVVSLVVCVCTRSDFVIAC